MSPQGCRGQCGEFRFSRLGRAGSIVFGLYSGPRPAANDPDEQEPLSTGHLAEFSSHLFTHNLQVSLFAFALGITFGIGTVLGLACGLWLALAPTAGLTRPCLWISLGYQS